ncbi:MAG: ribonuclease R [Clostridiales bacterium]|jgi:ribonuclease R|nr:ribonuclease R [Clostridiales bacterium]
MTYAEFIKFKGLLPYFPKNVNDQVDGIPNSVTQKDIDGRRDLRNLNTVTIDGDDSKDFDDAISISMLKNGNYYLGVHIADVSHYVTPNSALDREAFSRATSVYLINNVIPMLPKELSNGICSLNPQVDRLTLTIFLEIDHTGGVINYEICESVINSNERMTYNNVTKILDGDPELYKRYDYLVDEFKLMLKLSKILEAKRLKRGALNFDFPEPKITLDKNDVPIKIEKYPITVSNHIIEEFMLIANETIARHINHLNIPLVYRVHENPATDKIENFSQMIKTFGVKLKIGDKGVKPKDLQEILEQIEGKDYYLAVSTCMLRSLMKARYSEENLGHFGLAAKYYCHFTSPIRRYPDLVVHRIVKDWLHKNLNERKLGFYEAFCINASTQSSEREVHATECEREWDSYKIAQFMEAHVGEEFDSTIVSVTSFGLFVQLDNLAQGLVHMSELDGDYYIFDEVRNILTGKHTGAVYQIGEKLHVKLIRVNPEARQIDFCLVTEKKSEEKSKKNKEDTDDNQSDDNKKTKKGKHSGKRSKKDKVVVQKKSASGKNDSGKKSNKGETKRAHHHKPKSGKKNKKRKNNNE